MAGQPGFFDSDERLAWLSAAGDPLERLAAVVDFELFRGELERSLRRSDRSKGGRPPYDAVLMFKVLVLQTLYTLSDDQTEYQLRDRLSFLPAVADGWPETPDDARTPVWTRKTPSKTPIRTRFYQTQTATRNAAITNYAATVKPSPSIALHLTDNSSVTDIL